MLWSCGYDGDGQASDTETVQDDGAVVEVLQEMHSKTVEQAVADQHGNVNTERLSSRRFIIILYSCSRGNESREAKTDARGDGKLSSVSGRTFFSSHIFEFLLPVPRN